MSDQVTKVLRSIRSWRLILKVDHSLQTELDMFLTLPAINNECPNLGRPTCSQALRSMVPTAHAMFPHVEARNQIVNQAFAATADRSFSSFHRLKSLLTFNLWITGVINNNAIFHVHEDVIDGIILMIVK